MSFFSGETFFTLYILIMAIAIALGCFQVKLKYYSIAVSILMIFLVMSSNISNLMFFVSFFFIEFVLVKLYIYIRTKKGRTGFIYGIFIFLSLLPLLLSKIGEVKEFSDIKIFQFIGISYITFRVIQMIIETFDGVIKEVRFFDFAEYILFFPTFSCGPIDRSRRFIEDANKKLLRSEYLEMIGTGIQKIFVGIFYKFVVANLFFKLLSPLWTKTVLCMIGYSYVYGFYMFFDFAGYSLMAIGTGYLLGIKVPENFNKPFISKDIKDFWARWHISLSKWFRDYVFSRFIMYSMKKKWFKTRLTTASIGFIINMLVMGFWHGLAIQYILYGLYHGVLLALTEIYQKKCKFHKRNKKKKWYIVITWFITINLVMFGFLIFSGHLIK